MAQFYFDTNGGDTGPVHDAIGRVFGTLAEARAHALTKLPIVAEALPLADGEFRTCTATARDEHGAPVCRYILTILADTIGPGSSRVMRPM